jgi:TonB family protein
MTQSQPKAYRDETVKGWIGSLLFHLILILVFYFTYVGESRRFDSFVEVTLGSFGEAPNVRRIEEIPDNRPQGSSKLAARVMVKKPSSAAVNLPERRFPIPDEIIHVPDSKKLDVVSEPSRRDIEGSDRQIIGEKETATGRSIEGEKLTGEGKRGTVGEGTGFPGSSVGAEIGRATGYSVQWVGGGTREKISGDLPKYPEGVRVEAQVRLRAVVAADGSIKTVFPIQKAHEKLEEAALKEVRFWKFESLGITQPQVDQTCTITFNFRLQ